MMYIHMCTCVFIDVSGCIYSCINILKNLLVAVDESPNIHILCAKPQPIEHISFTAKFVAFHQDSF
jgi:hypothetical protein